LRWDIITATDVTGFVNSIVLSTSSAPHLLGTESGFGSLAISAIFIKVKLNYLIKKINLNNFFPIFAMVNGF
jgi:hypothetical protein